MRVHVQITLKDISGKVTKRWSKRLHDTREVREYFNTMVRKYSINRTVELRCLPDSSVRLRPMKHDLGNAVKLRTINPEQRRLLQSLGFRSPQQVGALVHWTYPLPLGALGRIVFFYYDEPTARDVFARSCQHAFRRGVNTTCDRVTTSLKQVVIELNGVQT